MSDSEHSTSQRSDLKGNTSPFIKEHSVVSVLKGRPCHLEIHSAVLTDEIRMTTNKIIKSATYSGRKEHVEGTGSKLNFFSVASTLEQCKRFT